MVHQVRHPLDVVASFVGRRFFSGDPAADPFLHFARTHVALTGNDVVDSMRWYVEWNERCEAHAALRYRLEDIDAALPGVLAALGKDVPLERQRSALAMMPRTVNRRGGPTPMVWSDLPAGRERDRLWAAAGRYGYEATSGSA